MFIKSCLFVRLRSDQCCLPLPDLTGLNNIPAQVLGSGWNEVGEERRRLGLTDWNISVVVRTPG